MEPRTSVGVGPLQLLRMTDGLILHQALYAVAKLGVADLLRDCNRSTSDLAEALRVNEDALYRALRFLAGQGIFCETAPRTFMNSALSRYLCADVPDSVRSILVFRGSPYYFSSFGDFLFSVETGTPAREKALGIDSFEYLRRNPEEARIFDEAMTAISALWAAEIATAYDFGTWASLVDLGGGNGLLLATILNAYPRLRGVLADQAPVLDRARERGHLSANLSDRTQFEAANFLDAVPSGCRAYMMKNILHDWDDGRARQILLNCRRAVPEDGALLLVEYFVADRNVSSLGKTVDLVMLAVTGGRERTVDEHRELLAISGFRMNRVIPIRNEVVIIEAIPA